MPVSVVVQPQHRLTTLEIEQVVEGYVAGATASELAAKVDCHRLTISRALRAAGVRLRLDGLTAEQIEEAIVLYESGLSLARVGDQLDVAPGTILRHLRERGVARRDSHGRVTV